jgi:hypothetical protein
VKEERREVEVEVDVVDPPRRTRALTRGMRRAAARHHPRRRGEVRWWRRGKQRDGERKKISI